MEVLKKEVDPNVVAPVSEHEKQKALAKVAADERSKNEEENARAQGFMKDLEVLIRKWDVRLIADLRMIGFGNVIEQTLNVGCKPMPKLPKADPELLDKTNDYGKA